jgi:hypothetical protein
MKKKPNPLQIFFSLFISLSKLHYYKNKNKTNSLFSNLSVCFSSHFVLFKLNYHAKMKTNDKPISQKWKKKPHSLSPFLSPSLQISLYFTPCVFGMTTVGVLYAINLNSRMKNAWNTVIKISKGTSFVFVVLPNPAQYIQSFFKCKSYTFTRTCIVFQNNKVRLSSRRRQTQHKNDLILINHQHSKLKDTHNITHIQHYNLKQRPRVSYSTLLKHIN